MADIDPELVERAIRWCAEAGRQTTPAAVRAALAGLGWDELLAARALLADPPPARPLGPWALADVARGAPADVAAEREREGRYAPETGTADHPNVATASPAAAPRARPRGRQRSRPDFVIRRASDRGEAPPPPSPAPPLLDELLLDEGRSVLERLLRRHGGRRARIVEALASGWRRPDGGGPSGDDLDRLLAHHGLAHAFDARERDEILHALRAAGGVRVRAAAALGIDLATLDGTLGRLGAVEEAERLREQRRRALRARGTLTQRTHLLLDETELVADLGLLEEFTRDLAARLPDHVRALASSSREPVIDLVGRSLSLDVAAIERLGQFTGLRLAELPSGTAATHRPPPRDRDRGPSPGPRAPGGRPPFKGRPKSGSRPAFGGRPKSGDRPELGSRPRTGSRPASGDRARPGSRPAFGDRPKPGARPTGGERKRPGSRPGPAAGRPSGGRRGPAGDRGRPGPRPGGKRPPKRS